MTSVRKRLAGGLLLASLSFLIFSASDANAIPAFARKYGLRCFRLPRGLADAQLLRPEVQRQRLSVDERPGRSDLAEHGYWPVTIRITPNWHRESTNKMAFDQAPTGHSRSPPRFRQWRARHPVGGHAGKEYFLPVGSLVG